MEECNGGEFFDSLAKRAKEKKMYTEKECASIFKQILEGKIDYPSHLSDLSKDFIFYIL